jgi:hypothetical protein
MAMILSVSLPAGAAEIWMAPFDPVWREVHGWPPNGYMALFEPGSPWRQAARSVNVFELYKKFVEQASDSDLEKIIRDLRRRRIALAMQGTPLVATDTCGRGVEGYGPPHDMLRAAARIRRLGGTVVYVALDEPLYHGHRFARRPLFPYQTHHPIPCHSAVTDLARQAATKIAELHQIFPTAKVGDVEPVGAYPPEETGNFSTDFSEWLDAYNKAIGRPLAFVDLDVVWPKPGWPAQFDSAGTALRNAGIPLGVIYDGTPGASSDAQWVASARDHTGTIERRLGARPDRIIFQTWTDYPRRMLPDTSPDTFTGLIRGYVDRR